MTRASTRRIVVVSRPTEWDQLVARHATAPAAAFFLKSRDRDTASVRRRDDDQEDALGGISAMIPVSWRRVRLDRSHLPGFLFEPGDIVVAVGQDGLVPNVAKYLDGQPVIGVNPDPSRHEGSLVRFPVAAAGEVIAAVDAGAAVIEERTMVQATLDDGRTLVALNEVFVGHRSHQSARYLLTTGTVGERQSSSGIIVATGTGAGGWARSISNDRGGPVGLPHPEERSLVWFVREAWPSVATGADLTAGRLAADEHLAVVSEMEQGGVAFGDGIEEDWIPLGYGQELRVAVAPRVLRLVVAV